MLHLTLANRTKFWSSKKPYTEEENKKKLRIKKEKKKKKIYTLIREDLLLRLQYITMHYE